MVLATLSPVMTAEHQPLQTGQEHLVAVPLDRKGVCLDFLPGESTMIQGSVQLA